MRISILLTLLVLSAPAYAGCPSLFSISKTEENPTPRPELVWSTVAQEMVFDVYHFPGERAQRVVIRTPEIGEQAFDVAGTIVRPIHFWTEENPKGRGLTSAMAIRSVIGGNVSLVLLVSFHDGKVSQRNLVYPIEASDPPPHLEVRTRSELPSGWASKIKGDYFPFWVRESKGYLVYTDFYGGEIRVPTNGARATSPVPARRLEGTLTPQAK